MAAVDLVQKATALDAELRKQWAGMKRLARVIGGNFKQIRDEKLYKFIRKPGSQKSFVAFEEYVSAITGGLANSTIWFFMRIHSLTEGPHAMADKDVDEMAQGNAYALSKLLPEERTPEVIEKAKNTPIKKFQAVIQEIKNQSLPPGRRKAVLVEVHEKWPPEIAEMFDDCIADFSLLPVVLDGDRDVAIRHKAIAAILISARSYAREEIEEALRNQEMEIADEHIREMAAAANG